MSWIGIIIIYLLCVCTYMCISECSWMCVCVCEPKPKENIGYYSSSEINHFVFALFLSKVSLLGPELDWLSSEPGILSIELRSLCLHGTHLNNWAVSQNPNITFQYQRNCSIIQMINNYVCISSFAFPWLSSLFFLLFVFRVSLCRLNWIVTHYTA